MKIIDTSTMDPLALNPNHAYWVYNGLDCCITLEILEQLLPQLDDTTRVTYQRELDLQAPYMEMMLRGIKVNKEHIRRALKNLKHLLSDLETHFNTLCIDGLGLELRPAKKGEKPMAINWRSHTQVKFLLYDVLKLPVLKKRNSQGKMAPAADRETLEKHLQHYFSEPLITHILSMRDLGKQIGFLETKFDADGRMRTNFNIAGTNTGRLSSSFSVSGTGTNLQNVAVGLRYGFVADEGKLLVNVDLEQADSRNVGALCWNLFVDEHGEDFAGSYLDACESGDLHTFVCQMAWTDLDWSGDNPRAVANEIAYRGLSYRDLAKKLGHGTNYYGQPPTMAKHSKVPVGQIIEFQHKYFKAFPCIPAYHEYVINQLHTEGQLTNLYGRRRFFFGRHEDQSVINAAIAYMPQGTTGDQINDGILRLWRDPRFEPLIQVHDSILFQIDQNEAEHLIPIALNLLRSTIILKRSREFYVPLEAQTGWNWGYAGKNNYHGLTRWKGTESRNPPKIIFPRKKGFQEYL